jgi:hypothetical protein
MLLKNNTLIFKSCQSSLFVFSIEFVTLRRAPGDASKKSAVPDALETLLARNEWKTGNRLHNIML